MDKLLKLRKKRGAQIKQLRALVAGAEKESRSLTDEEQTDFDEVEARIAQLDEDIKREQRLLDLESSVDNGSSNIIDPEDEEARNNDQKPEYRSVFFKSLRGEDLNKNEMEVMEEQRALSVKEGQDGGYVIPVDIQTRINELKGTVDSLEQYVTVEPVSTSKGARTLERRADSTPFQPLDEYETIGEMNAPKFDRLSYSIDDYAGFLPVPNNLLNDSDQAIETYLEKWIAKKSRATRNHLILEALDSWSKVALDGFDGIQKVLDIELDPAHEQSATIFTNQDGFNWMRRQKDRNGRSLMQPDPTNAARKMYDGKVVVKLSNKTIQSDGVLAPVIIGDLKEAIVLWDRQQLSIDMTKVGGQAWRTNSSEFRAIEREDVTVWDGEAAVYGQLDTSVDITYGNPEVPADPEA